MSLIIPSIDSTNISNINNARVSYSSFARESNRFWSSIASDSTGTKLAAAASSDRIYTSTDSGLTWTPRENNRAWYDIASNSDGTVLVAILISGTQVYISTDSGLNWTPRTVTVSNKDWRSVAINSTGTVMAAVAVFDANVYVSTDTGSTWVARGTGAPGTPEFESIAMNSSGTIMITSNFGGRLYVSTDSGTTWNNRDSDRGWLSVASNSSGDNLFAVVYGGLDGFVYRSTDFGVTWVAQMTDASRNWFYIASNSTGRRLIALIGARGAPSQLYISIDSGVSWVVRESTRNWVEGASNSDGTKFFAVASSDKIYMIVASNPFITIGNSFMNALGENTDNLSVAYIPSAAISATNAMTTTNYSSLYIEGAPMLSTNVTGTNPYALNVGSGSSIFGGSVTIARGLTSSGITTFSGTGNSAIASSSIYVNPSTTTVSGTNSNVFFSSFASPPLTVSSGTTTNASTVYIAGAPTKSGAGTLTNAYALNVNSGGSVFGGPIKGNASFGGINESVLICPNTESATATTTLQIVPSSTTPWTGGLAQIIMGDATHSIRQQFLGDSSGRMEFIDINGFQFRRTTAAASLHTSVSSTGNWTFTGTGNSAIASSSIYVNPSTTTVSSSVTDVFFTSFASPPLTVSSGTTTNASTVYIAGAPTKSGAGTLTNAYALNVNSGGSLFGGPIKGNVLADSVAESVIICPRTESTTATSTLQILPSSTATWTSGGLAQVIFGDRNHRIITGWGIGMRFTDVDGFQFRGATGSDHTTVSSLGNWSFLNTTQSTSATTGAIIVGGGIGMGAGTTGAPPILNWGNTYAVSAMTKMISLFDSTNLATDPRYYGFGISNGILRYHIDSTANAHVFYAGTGAATSNELFRVNGSGGVRIGSSGSDINTLRTGSVTISPPATNNIQVTVTHGLGTTPVFASGIVNKNPVGANTDCFSVTVRSWNSTQIVFQVFRLDANAGWGNAYSLNWMAHM